MHLYPISWAIKTIAARLAAAYQSEAEAVRAAQELVGYVTKYSRTELIIFAEKQIDQTTWQKIESLALEHLNQDKPLAYILQKQPFLSLDLTIEPPILIPRPETEWWTAQVINQCQQLQPSDTDRLQILDLCTGSGCIALALAHALPQSLVTGIDKNPAAIACAQKNAINNNIDNTVFVQSDLFAAIANQNFDLIVANPPYISLTDYQTLEKSVREWEDPHALWAPNKGTALIRRIVQHATKHLTEKLRGTIPRLWIEIGYDQAFLAQELSEPSLQLTCLHDQFDTPRLVVEKLPNH